MLSSETFQRRAKAKFSAEMWADADDLERKIYKSKKKVAGWTTNGREVAYYIEDIDIVGEMPNKWIHYIAEDGTSSSRDESFNDWYYYGSSGAQFNCVLKIVLTFLLTFLLSFAVLLDTQ